MLDSLFAFFFKYSPYVFEQGELRLAFSSPVYIAIGIAAAAALTTVLTYRSAPGDASWLDRAVLITLRLCLVGLVPDGGIPAALGQIGVPVPGM